MDVTLHNNIEQCPKQCGDAEIKGRQELSYVGPHKAWIVGVDVFVTCAHINVCRRRFEQLAERSDIDRCDASPKRDGGGSEP